MGSDLNITKELQEYILSHGFNLHPVQKEIIDYNTSLGDIKRMQISISLPLLNFSAPLNISPISTDNINQV